jgi:anti-anti-sigma factor
VVSARLADGEVFDSAKLKNTVRFLIENDMRNVVIDLGNLEYLYSDTINAFIASNRHMLEVSGRIAILTEHPKVQDILKRAGLDNIMRIYRSEAEMIADSKEILRQTSSYRIEELQKISSQPIAAPEPPPVPRTEFDDFKAEMGNQLGSKLDNNELPQYQLGVPQNGTPANFAPPQPPSYPAYNQPTFVPPQAPENVPAYNNNYSASPAYGLGNNNPGFAPSQPGQGFGSVPGTPPPPANFDFPTVQLPINQFSSQSLTPGSMRRDEPPAQEMDNDSDLADSRQRKPSQERMRSPNARKQQGRRVGGREFTGDDAQERSYQEPVQPIQQEPGTPYAYQTSTQPVLVEESRSPAKLLFFLLFLAAAAVGVYFFMSKKSAEEPKTALEVPATPAETGPVEPAQPPAAVTPGATVTPAVPPVAAAPTPAAVVPKPPAAPEKPAAVETPKPPVKETAPPKPKAVVAHKKPAKEPKEQREPKAVVSAPAQEESAPPAASGRGLHITSNPSGAEVLINFSKKGSTPLDVSLLNNSNKVIVRLAGYKRFETTLPKNYPDRELNVDLDREGGSNEARASEPPPPREPDIAPPEPKPAEVARQPDRSEAPPARTKPAPEPASSAPVGDGPIGVIFLSSSPARADILIDGKDTGKKTPAKLELPSGSHHIEMVKSGQRASVDQVVNEGKNKACHLTLQ